jgi:hypothetical protein
MNRGDILIMKTTTVLVAVLLSSSVAHAADTGERLLQKVGLSGLLCAQKEWLKKNQDDIKEQYASAREGGVLDMSSVNDSQIAIRKVRMVIAETTAALKRLNIKPLSCTADDRTRLGDCGNMLKIGPSDWTPWYGKSLMSNGEDMCYIEGAQEAIAAAKEVL